MGTSVDGRIRTGAAGDHGKCLVNYEWVWQVSEAVFRTWKSARLAELWHTDVDEGVILTLVRALSEKFRRFFHYVQGGTAAMHHGWWCMRQWRSQ